MNTNPSPEARCFYVQWEPGRPSVLERVVRTADLEIVRHAVKNGEWESLDAMRLVVGDALDELIGDRQ